MRAAWHCGSVAPIRADAARQPVRLFASLCSHHCSARRRKALPSWRGTDGSNPSPSSGESRANLKTTSTSRFRHSIAHQHQHRGGVRVERHAGPVGGASDLRLTGGNRPRDRRYCCLLACAGSAADTTPRERGRSSRLPVRSAASAVKLVPLSSKTVYSTVGRLATVPPNKHQ
jgi:hypothetical protein